MALNNAHAPVYLNMRCITVIIITLSTLIASNIIACSNEIDDGFETPTTELDDIQIAVVSMMIASDPPIEDLSTDKRIAGFSSTEAEATNDLTDDGLIDIVDEYIEEENVKPVSDWIGIDFTSSLYWVEADGKVHEVVK